MVTFSDSAKKVRRTNVTPVHHKHTYHAFRSMSYNESSFETIPSLSISNHIRERILLIIIIEPETADCSEIINIL